MSEPLVSVIVGVYNKERFVGDCLRSVLAQTFGDFELIVVDDASTDESAQVIQTLRDPRIRFVQRSVNSGLPAVPRNEGIRMARGEYLAFLDGDDAWMPEKLEKQVAHMVAHPEHPLTHTLCQVMDDEGRFLRLRHGLEQLPSGDCLERLLEHCWISISSVMVRKELVGQIGGFDESPALKAREDYDWLLRAAVVARFGVILECLASYRAGPDSISHAAGNWRSTPRDYLSHRDALRNIGRWGGKIGRGKLEGILLSAAEENAYFWRERGEHGKSAWFAWEMVRLSPGSFRGWRQLVAAGLRRRSRVKAAAGA